MVQQRLRQTQSGQGVGECLRVLIRVVFFAELSVGRLYLFVVGLFVNAKDLVVVFGADDQVQEGQQEQPGCPMK